MLAGGQDDALELPFVKLLHPGILAPLAKIERLIRRSRLQRVPETFHDLISDPPRPDEMDDFRKIPADHGADLVENGQRHGVDLLQAQPGIHHINADRRLRDEGGK